MAAAEHLPSGRPVALRVFRPRFTDDPVLGDMLWRALRSALELNHPRLLGVLELGETREGTVWAVLERGAPWSPPRDADSAQRDLDDLLQALAHVHAHHRFHGDLRPGHLYRDPDGRLLLADAGLAGVVPPDELATELAAVGRGVGAREAAQARDMAALAELVRGWPLPPSAVLRLAAPRATAPPGNAPPRPWSVRPLHADAQTLPFVGREAERRALTAAGVRTTQGDGARLVLLEGEAGVGRARLCRWAATQLAASGGMDWLWGWHGPNGGHGQGLRGLVARHLGLPDRPQALARRPLRALLRSPERFEGPDEDADRLVDWLLPLSDQPPVGRLDAWRGVLGLLRAECRRGGRVLVLEEGWWSPWTLGFVHHLLSQATELPVLVLLTVRADRLERRPQAAALLDALAARPETGRLRLAPLGRDEMNSLLEDVLSVGPALRDRLAERTLGRPLELVELVRELDQTGRLTVGDGRLRDIAPGATALPPTLDALWQGRVARLPEGRPGWVEALACAALLGGSAADPHWVSLAADVGAPDARRLVHRARRAGLLGRSSPGDPAGLRLAHGSLVPALVRLVRRRGSLVRLHQRCVDRAVASPGSPAALRHRFGAQQPDAARREGTTALARALARGDAGHATELLRLLETSEPAAAHTDPLLARIAVLRAALEELRGESDPGRPTALRMLAAAERAGWPEVVREARLLLAQVALQAGESEECRRHGRAAEDAARRHSDTGALRRAWVLLGWQALLAGHRDEVDEYLSLLGEGRARVLLELRARAELDGECSGALVAAVGPAIDRARADAAWGELGALHGLRADLHRRRGAVDEAHADYRQAGLWTHALAARAWWPPTLGLGLLQLQQGHWRKAARSLDADLPLLERRGPPGLAGLAHLGLAAVSARRQRPAALFHTRRAAALLRQGQARSPDVATLCAAVPTEPGSALADLVERVRGLHSGTDP